MHLWQTGQPESTCSWVLLTHSNGWRPWLMCIDDHAVIVLLFPVSCCCYTPLSCLSSPLFAPSLSCCTAELASTDRVGWLLPASLMNALYTDTGNETFASKGRSSGALAWGASHRRLHQKETRCL